MKRALFLFLLLSSCSPPTLEERCREIVEEHRDPSVIWERQWIACIHYHRQMGERP